MRQPSSWLPSCGLHSSLARRLGSRGLHQKAGQDKKHRKMQKNRGRMEVDSRFRGGSSCHSIMSRVPQVA